MADASITDAERTQITEVVRGLSNIGVLLSDGVLSPKSGALDLIADYCIHCWLVLENYISKERERRDNPSWQAGVQYLVVVSLAIYLKKHRSVTIYSTESRKSRKYSYSELFSKLQELGNQLV